METNDPIYKKKSLHGNFDLLYNISKIQNDSSTGRCLNPGLLLGRQHRRHRRRRRRQTTGGNDFVTGKYFLPVTKSSFAPHFKKSEAS